MMRVIRTTLPRAGLVSVGQHCFLRLAHALYCLPRRCLAYVAFSV